MIGARPRPGRSLGLTDDELARSPYRRFHRPALATLPAHAIDAVARGPVAPERLPKLADAASMFEDAPQFLENGYALPSTRAAHVAIRTAMPGCTPAMVDWWFGWHSDDPVRYKLWHPGAHVHASWADGPRPGAVGRARYVGRTSHVDEYLGSTLGRFAIRFVAPSALGLGHPSLEEPGTATLIAARVGLAELPLDVGYLAHHVRRTDDGAEMRSRFWLGGPYAAPRFGGSLSTLAVRAATHLLRPTREDAVDLLVHCAEEMQHLAGFLPDIHRAFADEPPP